MQQKLFVGALFMIAIVLGAATPSLAQGEGAIHGTMTPRRMDQPFLGQSLNSKAPLSLRR